MADGRGTAPVIVFAVSARRSPKRESKGRYGMATANNGGYLGKPGSQDKARIRIDIEAVGDDGEEFVIRIYSGHGQTTEGDRALMLVLYKAMSALMTHPSRTKTDASGKKVAPKTKSGKPFPTLFPFVKRRK